MMASVIHPGRRRPPDPLKRRNPALGGTGSRGTEQLGSRLNPENTPPAPGAQPALSAALHRWAARRGEALADEFVRSAAQGEASAFFEEVIGREKLLAALRPTAEAAFLARVASAGPAGLSR